MSPSKNEVETLLRETSDEIRSEGALVWSNTCENGADEIARLDREVERLQREAEHRERYWAQFDHVPKGNAPETEDDGWYEHPDGRITVADITLRRPGEMPDAQDAARYRWLRSRIAITIIQRIKPDAIDLRSEALDALIDCRMDRTGQTPVKPIKRWDAKAGFPGEVYFDESEHGEWVRYEDVRHLLINAALPEKEQVYRAALEAIRNRLRSDPADHAVIQDAYHMANKALFGAGTPFEMPECQHTQTNGIADTHASWCTECGAFHDGSEWIYPRSTVKSTPCTGCNSTPCVCTELSAAQKSNVRPCPKCLAPDANECLCAPDEQWAASSEDAQ